MHPLVVAGWVGLFTNALNLLPVGSLDGGRLVQAAFGKGSLGTTSIITYICLALGLLGGSLALPFGLYIIILNRQPENYIQVDAAAPPLIPPYPARHCARSSSASSIHGGPIA